jgi:hypothetical protein
VLIQHRLHRDMLESGVGKARVPHRGDQLTAAAVCPPSRWS